MTGVLIALAALVMIAGFVVVGRKMIAETRSTVNEWQKLNEKGRR